MPFRPRLAIWSSVGCVSIVSSFVLLLVVGGATDIVVTRGGLNGLRFREGLVEASRQNGLHRGVADGVVSECPIAGGLEPITAKPALQAQYPQGRPVALFGVRPVAHQPFDKNSDVIAHAAGP